MSKEYKLFFAWLFTYVKFYSLYSLFARAQLQNTVGNISKHYAENSKQLAADSWLSYIEFQILEINQSIMRHISSSYQNTYLCWGGVVTASFCSVNV